MFLDGVTLKAPKGAGVVSPTIENPAIDLPITWYLKIN